MELANDLQKRMESVEPGGELDFYLNNAYSNLHFFIQSLTQHNSITYTFFGDIRKDLYFISDNMRDDFGFDSNLVVGLLGEWRKRIHGEKWKKTYDNDIQNMLDPDYVFHDLHYQVRNKYGKVLWIRCCGDLKWNEDHTEPIFFAGRVSRQSDYFIIDPVTNFPTKDTLQRYLQIRNVDHKTFWTIGFSFNKMSKINTLQGNDFADRLILGISNELVDVLGDYVTFYRLPGVRCLALLDCDIDKDIVVEKIRKVVAKKYMDAGLVVDIPCSFVAVKFPQPGWSIPVFLENMVDLIRLAQQEKRCDYIVNTDENIEKIRTITNMSMTITKNVLNNMENFRAVVQPVVSVKTGKIIGGETLMRWKFMDKDISPELFIPILEKDRMIQVAGRWIFEEAVKVCSEIVKKSPDFYLTFNVSLQQLYDNDLIPFIPEILEKYNLSGKNMVIEMTESCMDNEPGKLMELITKSQNLGIRLALDDFGTGYSSMRVLMKYPIDIIKIDRSLLLEMEESEDKNLFITNLVHACHQFGKKICVEGVETAHQQKLIKKGGGDMIQGFYYYRPMEIEDLLKVVSKN